VLYTLFHWSEEARANVDVATKGAETALHFAAWAGRGGACGALLGLEADAAKAECCGASPLHLAALGGHLTCVELLLGFGADCSAKVRDHSHLWRAVDPTLASPLPCYGPLMCADCSAKDAAGMTAADLAMACGHLDLAGALAKRMRAQVHLCLLPVAAYCLLRAPALPALHLLLHIRV